MRKIIFLTTATLAIFSFQFANAQEKAQVNWISFTELHAAFIANPKPVMINFYADWCSVCLKMDKTTFQDQQIIDKLNRDFYVVRMNVESNDTIHFGNQVFVNKRINRVNPVHEIAQMLASRKDRLFSLPAIVFLDAEFTPRSRYFQYLDVKTLMSIL